MELLHRLLRFKKLKINSQNLKKKNFCVTLFPLLSASNARERLSGLFNFPRSKVTRVRALTEVSCNLRILQYEQKKLYTFDWMTESENYDVWYFIFLCWITHIGCPSEYDYWVRLVSCFESSFGTLFLNAHLHAFIPFLRSSLERHGHGIHNMNAVCLLDKFITLTRQERYRVLAGMSFLWCSSRLFMYTQILPVNLQFRFKVLFRLCNKFAF